MKLFLLFLLAVISAPAVLGQTEDPRRYEFYGGYAYERAVDPPRTVGIFQGDLAVGLSRRDQNYHGFTGEFNQNFSRHWGLVTNFTGVYDKTPYTTSLGQLKAKASRYDLMFGPRYNFRLGRFNPFAEGMAGFEHMHVNYVLASDGEIASASDTAFAMAFGGGVDIRLNSRFDVRAIQADYIPTFFNSTHQNNYRLGAGLKVKVGPDP